jgi:type 1 glutamine amidotransferase
MKFPARSSAKPLLSPSLFGPAAFLSLGIISALTLGSLDLHAAEAKRVLVVTITTGFRHSSIETAEKTLQKLATDSKQFQIVDFLRQPAIVVPKKPTPPRTLAPDADEAAKKRFDSQMAHYQELLSKWTPEIDAEAKKAEAAFHAEASRTLSRLAPAQLEKDKIDGVIFANTTGDLPLPDREGFVNWIAQGHGFMAMHSGSDTLHGFTGYREMLGGEFLTHGAQSPIELEALDPQHPAASGLKSPWNIKQEEMYHLKSYERSKVRDIWASSKLPMDGRPNQGQPGHFPVSWVRKEGSGRVFYTSLGHREDVWDDSPSLLNRINPPEVAQAFQNHVLGGIRWALSIAEGSAEPQVKSSDAPAK